MHNFCPRWFNIGDWTRTFWLECKHTDCKPEPVQATEPLIERQKLEGVLSLNLEEAVTPAHRFQKSFLPAQVSLQTIDFYRFSFRVNNPVFSYPEFCIESLFLHQIGICSGFWKYFNHKVRGTLKIVSANNMGSFLRNEKDIGLDNIFLIKIDITQSVKHPAELLFSHKAFYFIHDIFWYPLMIRNRFLQIHSVFSVIQNL